MTEQVRYRIKKKLVKEAEKVCEEIGISPSQAVSMFFAQMVKVGGVPFAFEISCAGGVWCHAG